VYQHRSGEAAVTHTNTWRQNMAQRLTPVRAVSFESNSSRSRHDGRRRSKFRQRRAALPRHARLIGICGMLLLLTLAGPGFADEPVATGPADSITQLKVNPDGWTSSEVCGKCHQAIHAVWRESLHAKAWSNGIFQASYRRCTEEYGDQQAQMCLKCHAPTVRHGEDYDAKNAITREGITCDFCHSVSAVDLADAKDPIRISVGKTKYGPLRHVQSPAHEIVDTKLHTQSEFCASCHEYRNANGVAVLSTYSEWKESSYAKKGKQCQDCHMPLVPGRVVALNVKQDSGNSVNLHDVSGSHDIDRVRDAIKLEIVGHEWLGDRVWVFIQVANERSGHCFPTGMPMHRAVLEVTLHDGGKLVGRRDIPFEIVMLDKNRRPLKREYEVLVSAASIRSDTRLKPNEKRTLDIPFRDAKAKKLALSAMLYYSYKTETVTTEAGEDKFEPVEMKFLIASRRTSIKPLGN